MKQNVMVPSIRDCATSDFLSAHHARRSWKIKSEQHFYERQGVSRRTVHVAV